MPLVGGITELLEEMKCYLSFSDEDVFKGVALPEDAPVIPPDEVTPRVPNQHQSTSL